MPKGKRRIGKVQIYLFNVEQAYEYFGGNIGRDTLLGLMKMDVLKTIKLSGKGYLTTRENCQRLVEEMFEKRLTSKNFESYPVALTNNLSIT